MRFFNPVRFLPPAKPRLKTLARVAGQRGQIEQAFQAAKGECGLDHYEVRHWQGWRRHITLAMLAHAVLAILRERGEKKLPARSTSACPNCAPCSSECCGADGTALNISSIGQDGEDDIHSTPCAATIENAAHRCQSSIYNCSTKLNDFFLATCIPTIQQFHWTSLEPKPHFPT